MDGKWLLPIVPTECKADSETISTRFTELFPAFTALTPRAQPFLIDQVTALTVTLKKHAYCPATWTSRAYNLLRLGYPDLAVGDAYKAQALINIYLENGVKYREVFKELWRQVKRTRGSNPSDALQRAEKASRIDKYVLRTSDRSALVLAQALIKANCYVECREYLTEYTPKLESSRDGLEKLKALAERACRIEDLNRTRDREEVREWSKASLEQKRSGSITPQIYPWMASYTKRQGVVFHMAKAKVNSSTQGGCSLKTSTIVGTAPPTDETEDEGDSKILGIFANKNFSVGDVVMVDKTALSGIDEQTSRCSCCRGLFSEGHLYYYRSPCCDTPLCSEECKTICMAQYHYPQCIELPDIRNSNMDLFTQHASEDTLAMNDLLYRVFAHAENTPQFFPLRVPAIGAMTPAHHNNEPVLFSVINDIQRPFEMLQDLGIDIFADQAYDTWVIQAIQARIRNNVRVYEDDHGQYHAALNLSFMFFNHSCEPNVDIEIPATGSSNITVKAIKPIQAGDELFITYLDDEDLKLSHDERQECLATWMEECQCRRCQADRVFAELPLTPAISLDDPFDDDYRIDDDSEEEDYEDEEEEEEGEEEDSDEGDGNGGDHYDEEEDDDDSKASTLIDPRPLAITHPSTPTLRSRIFGNQSTDVFDWNFDEGLIETPSKRRRIR